MNNKIRLIIKEIPNSPGCYKYFNKKGELIYIGKAKDLRKRVYSYFVGANDIKTTVLVENIADIKWETTESEIEALILESLLIKKYKPKFNIKVKDDKDFLWVKIDFKKDFPCPELVRKPQPETKIKLFGPFTDPKLLKQGLTVLRKIFLWRDCSDSKFSFYKKKGKPCLEYYIKNCSAPCNNYINSNDYQLGIKHLITFLKGGKKKIINDLERQMKILSKKKEFEKAAVIRDKIKSLKHIDVSLKMNYESRIKNHDSKFIIHNSENNFLKKFISTINKDLGYRIKYKDNLRIEFYDISNTSGKEAVGSMVVWQDSSLNKNEYRKFKIKFIKGPNDVGMMREVLFRRAKKLKVEGYKVIKGEEYWSTPDLIVLDGGKPQLGEIAKLFSQLKIDIPVISLAKEQEEVWGVKSYKVIKFVKLGITKNSPEGFFIQRLRDEAHRFAIGYHKVLRSKKAISSRLDNIEGLGPVNKKKLLLKFGSVDGIIKTDLVEIEKVVGKKLAKRIKEIL